MSPQPKCDCGAVLEPAGLLPDGRQMLRHPGEAQPDCIAWAIKEPSRPALGEPEAPA